MNAERLHQLIQAWGAQPRLWPADERAAAERLLAEQPALAGVLDEARDVDALLAAPARPVPSAALRDRVLASAIETGLGARRAAGGLLDLGRRLSWLAGAGWAAAACAGALSGVMLTTHLTADARAEAVYEQAALVVIDDTEVLG